MHKFFSNLLKAVTSRLFFYAVLIVAQLYLLFHWMVKLSQSAVWVVTLMYVVSLLAVLAITSSEKNSSYKIIWIIAILCFPLLGGLCYLIWQLLSLPARRKLAGAREQRASLYAQSPGCSSELKDEYPWLYTQSRYITRSSGFPPYAGTDVKYCRVGEEMLAEMLPVLQGAQRFIFLEYFIIGEGVMWDAIFAVLKERIAHGVEVRVLYDDVGSMTKLPRRCVREMREAGVKVAVFNRFKPAADPLLNYRDHRKICVVDGRVGFCGGINIADEYINAWNRCGHWKDTAVMLRGDAVQSLTRIFLQLWTATYKEPDGQERDFAPYLVGESVPSKGFVQPFPDDPGDKYNVAENVYIQMINRADRYVYITTPYLILDKEMSAALCTAAESGIDVRIITPGIPDKEYVYMVTRSNYLPLLRSGVKIYEYTPGFMHAKMFISDDCSAVVGTANLDYRSLYLHFECAVALYDTPVIAEIKKDFLEAQAVSREVTEQERERVGLLNRLVTSVLRLLSPML